MEPWDRSKQNFWVRRTQELWYLVDSKTNRNVATIEPIQDNRILRSICFSKDLQEAISHNSTIKPIGEDSG